MINSRSILDLLPIVGRFATEHRRRLLACDIDIIITSTYRDKESQLQLYSQGRENKPDRGWIVIEPRKVVTKALPGYSFHNWKVAYDVVPLRAGKPVWGTEGADGLLWQKVGLVGKQVGLEWAGDWVTFKEYPHFQYTAGYSINDFITGKIDYKKFD
jgi:peptidoglycan L-alanyl-D-glutamate endopeptidase CwlK